MSILNIRLVNDVFGEDNDGKVPMEKVMLLIWKFRDDPGVVQFMAQFVTKVSFCVSFARSVYYPATNLTSFSLVSFSPTQRYLVFRKTRCFRWY